MQPVQQTPLSHCNRNCFVPFSIYFLCNCPSFPVCLFLSSSTLHWLLHLLNFLRLSYFPGSHAFVLPPHTCTDINSELGILRADSRRCAQLALLSFWLPSTADTQDGWNFRANKTSVSAALVNKIDEKAPTASVPWASSFAIAKLKLSTSAVQLASIP